VKFAIIVFPGSNCDQDAYHAAASVLGQSAELVWHKDTDLKGADVVILPGGFAHGDYLRTGAMARFSPIMGAVRSFAERGGPVLGICNGFQILLEAGLLPGAMLRNRGLKYRCEHVHVRVEQTETPFTCVARPGQVLHIPIGHGEGNYFAPPDVVQRIEANGQVLLRYVTADGEVEDAANPNGSVHAIAGLCNERRNVAGMMPHPERACERPLGSADGRVILDSIVEAVISGRWSVSAPGEAAVANGAGPHRGRPVPDTREHSGASASASVGGAPRAIK
jgi:phosphoribosylformylglycinamidine synthase